MSALSRIQKIFPPPRFMMLPSVGVDISDTSMKYVQFTERGSALSLGVWGDIPVPDGVVTRGNVLNKKGLTDVLKTLRQALPTSYIRVSLPEERAYLFETSIERGTPYKDIRGMLEFRMEENVPLSPRDAFFDYEIVEGTEPDEPLRVSVAVYAKDTIQQYYDACCEAGLMPLSFEVEADAIARATIPDDAPGSFLILDFGKTRTGLGIVERGALLYTSTIDIGGSHLSIALRELCGARDESEFTRLKNEHGLLKTGDGDEVYSALLPTIAVLREEVSTRVSYWNSTGDDKNPISKIILCGGSANLAGFPEYLTEALGIETERADVWRNAFSTDAELPPITRRYSYGYATAIGLALRDHRPNELS